MKSVIVEFRQSISGPFARHIADVQDGYLSVGGCRPSSTSMVGKTLSQPFEWHGWEGIIYVDGKKQGAGFHFPKSDRIIAELPDGRKVMHVGEGNVADGCRVGDKVYPTIIEAILDTIPA